jgi:hypothetical protein
MYGDDNCCIRVARKTNGYTVVIDDPAIVKYNRDRDKTNSTAKGDKYLPYKDPSKTFVFKTAKEVLKFLTDNIEKAIPNDDGDGSYDTSFKLAAADADEDT